MTSEGLCSFFCSCLEV